MEVVSVQVAAVVEVKGVHEGPRLRYHPEVGHLEQLRVCLFVGCLVCLIDCLFVCPAPTIYYFILSCVCLSVCV